MQWSITNPRVILIGLGGILLIAAVLGAYLEYPRVEVGFGLLAETVPLQQSGFDVNVRSADFRAEFRKILGSPQFMAQLTAIDPSIEAVFPGKTPEVTTFPTVPITNSSPKQDLASQWANQLSKVDHEDRIILMTLDLEEHDTGVVYMLFRQYRVSRSSFRWLERLQSWLPGMPDTEALAVRAEAANQAAKAALKKQIETAAQQAASVCRQGTVSGK